MSNSYKSYALIFVVLLLGYYHYHTRNSTEGFGRSKCFSCEAQDRANGIDRGYGTKCFSCEAQDRSNSIHRGYGTKCISCEKQTLT